MTPAFCIDALYSKNLDLNTHNTALTNLVYDPITTESFDKFFRCSNGKVFAVTSGQ